MAIEVAALAASLVGRVLLPYAKLGLKKIGEELKERGGAAVEEQATSLTGKVWDKVAGLFRSDEDRFALEQFQSKPDKAAPLFTDALEEKLAAEPAAAEDLNRMLQEPVGGGDGPTLQHIMAETFGYVDARGAHISGGQVAGVILGAPPLSAPAPAASIGPLPQPPRGTGPRDPGATGD